ncbi:hypothetical protein JQ633_17575 [Bradyrhizobium tropiciagri]|uniref:hypothetical protein n=1 Tax=Bradyrhizobium tropiciagri TaxID=312253 RepID=UPI001BA94CA4|nr:hypothetical protein [Bradyrhizobium tropiciagri]MBR0872180.1 hypothetical protein [Bradyrhizobium tropiciagri]
MLKGLALAASILAFGTISEAAHARTITTHERKSPQVHMQDGAWDSVAAKPMAPPENDPFAYHGGPKSNE